MSFRRIRILILLGILAGALGFTWLEQWMVRGWGTALAVDLVPINGDGSAAAAATIAALDAADFDDINAFLERETARYGVRVAPAMHLEVLPEAKARPPAPPQNGNVLETVWWSLKLRGWVYRQSGQWLPQLGRVKLFVLYHAPQDGVALAHSLGLQKGLIGVVHAYADPRQQGQNNLVIAHELLHTLGATDKYGAGGFPVYPDGVADPSLPADAPQREAEIMAGRYVNAAGKLTMPASLELCVIGPKTAHEINLDAAFARRYGAGG
ncbi:MAG: hypothetical protein LDL19_07680 [Thiobacillus sp.]|nr:hypothetical protein [Thiobacillus sp.]